VKPIRVLCVGRLKKPFWRDAAAEYATALSRLVPLEEAEVKDAPGTLSPAERTEREGSALVARIGAADRVIALDVRGQALDSETLARRLAAWIEDPGRRPCFVVGGAWGLAEAVRARAGLLLSLGPLTLPHELARVVLLEQLYRAATIIKGMPYHHG